jgi:hypothetical protein
MTLCWICSLICRPGKVGNADFGVCTLCIFSSIAQLYDLAHRRSNGVVVGGGRRGEDECWRPGAGGHGAGAPERPGLPRGRHRLSRLPCLLRRRQVLRSRPLPYSWGHLRIYLKPPSQQHGKIVCLCSLLLSVFIRIYLKPRPAALIAAVVYLDLYMHVL